jgi:hypothetical protein
MERNTVAGPNQIGIAAERLEKILHNLQNRHDGGGRSRPGGFNRNRSGGGAGRSSSGGGYRGNNDRNAAGGERSGGGERGGNDRGDRSRSFSGGNRSSKPRS